MTISGSITSKKRGDRTLHEVISKKMMTSELFLKQSNTSDFGTALIQYNVFVPACLIKNLGFLTAPKLYIIINMIHIALCYF